MLSVLVVSPDPSVPGGVSVFIDCLKRHLTRSAATGFYIGSRGRGDESVLGVCWRMLTAPVALMEKFHTEKFDVVHLNPSFDAKSLLRDGLLVLALRAAGCKRILFYLHGFDLGLQKNILGNAMLRRLTAWMLNKCALITVLGDAFRDGLIELGVDPARIVVTRTMFDGAVLRPTGMAPPARPYILFMSRFDREKGGRELVQAFAALAQDYPDYDLVLAGLGEDEAAMRKEAGALESRVHFPGYVGGAAKTALLQQCTIFALPTFYRSEGMPVAVLEAMGAGKVLMVGSAGAMAAIARDGENGVVLSDVTPHTVEQGLRHLLDDPARDAIGKRNAEFAWAHFEAKAVTAEIETLYQRVASC
jgi:glycosyltransferase involved in cell wall biosynthesis